LRTASNRWCRPALAATCLRATVILSPQGSPASPFLISSGKSPRLETTNEKGCALTMRREHKPVAMESICQEGNVHVKIGDETYMLNGDNLLMPVKKGQAPPDLKFFKESNK
jgi:hypothetical protein